MEIEKKKCSLSKHSEVDAINYCQECKIYLCNKCQNHHSELFEKHHLYNLDKNISDIFSDICQLENHFIKYEYFCQTHNQWCCAACIAKIKNKLYGQHTDCKVCLIKDIKDEKKNKLNENIKFLENLKNNLENWINKLKILYEKIIENKEELKIQIQKIFTKIRNALNEREDELLLEVENKYNINYFGEDIIKETEQLPNKINDSLNKGKKIEKEWDNENLNLLIYNCINIESNIEIIKYLNENIKRFNSIKNNKILFNPKEDNIKDFLGTIKKFGEISNISYKYKFRKCPKKVSESRKYVITGENENVLIKTSSENNWMGTICENELEKGKENKWKIKILKTTDSKRIMVGVASKDFDIKSSSFNTCGWYLCCCSFYSNPTLYSGPPYNYSNKNTNLNKVKDELIVVMDMNKRSLKFIIENEDKGDSYTDIPIDKPLFPAVLLYNQNDSVEITEC